MKLDSKGKIQALLNLTFMGWAIPVLSIPIHHIIDVRGNVQVKKAQWKSFHKAESGITLNGRDKIKLEKNASVTIYCSNDNQRTINKPGTYLVSRECAEKEPVPPLCEECNNDSRAIDSRADQTPLINLKK